MPLCIVSNFSTGGPLYVLLYIYIYIYITLFCKSCTVWFLFVFRKRYCSNFLFLGDLYQWSIEKGFGGRSLSRKYQELLELVN